MDFGFAADHAAVDIRLTKNAFKASPIVTVSARDDHVVGVRVIDPIQRLYKRHRTDGIGGRETIPVCKVFTFIDDRDRKPDCFCDFGGRDGNVTRAAQDQMRRCRNALDQDAVSDYRKLGFIDYRGDQLGIPERLFTVADRNRVKR